METLVIVVLLFIGLFILGLMVDGLLIRLSAGLVASEYRPTFARACGIALLAAVGAGIAQFVFALIGYALGDKDSIGLELLMWVLSIGMHVLAIAALAKNDYGEPMGIGRAILVTIVEFPIAIALVLVVVLFGLAVLTLTGTLPKAGEWMSRIPNLPAQKGLPFGKAAPWVQPNKFPSVDAAKREAVRRHPELGKAGSAFNRAYLDRHRRYQREQPSFFNDNAWPVTLADEIAAEQWRQRPAEPASF